MKVLRYGAVILMTIILLVGCGSQAEGTVPKETTVESNDSQTISTLEQEGETYPILAASVSSAPTTGIRGYIEEEEDSFVTYVSICYKKGDKVLFKTLNTDNQNYGDYEVHFQEGEENELIITKEERGKYQYDMIIYTIFLTEETYESIF